MMYDNKPFSHNYLLFIYLLWWYICSSLLFIFKSSHLFSYCWVLSVLCIMYLQVIYPICVLLIFSPSVTFLFVHVSLLALYESFQNIWVWNSKFYSSNRCWQLKQTKQHFKPLNKANAFQYLYPVTLIWSFQTCATSSHSTHSVITRAFIMWDHIAV